MEEGEAGLRKGSKLNEAEVSGKRRLRSCPHLPAPGAPPRGPRALPAPPRPGPGPAAWFRERGLFAERRGPRGRVRPPRRGSPAPPGLPPRAARRRRPAPARLIGCRSEGRRRGGRGDLISDADSLLRPVVPDPAAAGARRAGAARPTRDSGGGSGRPAAGSRGGACRLPVRSQRWLAAPCPKAVGSRRGSVTRRGPPGPARLGPRLAVPLPGARGVEEESDSARARSMGRAAAAGGARRWLAWLGLCFWAAGAAAARGKRGAAWAMGPRARRGGH